MKKILIMDDQPSILKAMNLFLTQEGFNIQTAENGYTGILKIVNDVPDLVIVDLNMPMMDGFTVIDRLKKNQNLNKIPIIVLSGFNDMNFIKRCKELGVNDYIIKPYDQVELLTRISKVLNIELKPEAGVIKLRDAREVMATQDKEKKKDQTMKIGTIEVSQKVDIEDLLPGMVLASPVKSKEGLTLLTGGTVITNTVIERLRELKIFTVFIKK